MSDVTNEPNPGHLIESAWKDQAIWSVTADRLKANLTWWRNLAACAGVLGALLETLSATAFSEVEKWRCGIALAGAVVLAVVPIVVKTKLSKERTSAWVGARSAAEALKATIYRFLLAAPPFDASRDPGAFVARCQAVKDNAQNLNAQAALTTPPTKVRPTTLTPEQYVATRVNDQIDKYYRPKAQSNALTAKRLHDGEFWLTVLAVVMGTLASAPAGLGVPQLAALGPWVAVVTTASAAVVAYLAASRAEYQSIAYFTTANRLTGIRDLWQADANRAAPEKVAQFVDACETTIATENQAWITEFNRDPGQRNTK